jgi:hypothetical protein
MNVLHLVKETVIVTNMEKKPGVTRGSSSRGIVFPHQQLTDGQVLQRALECVTRGVRTDLENT